MTMDRTLPPTKEVPYFKCSNEDCLNLWQPYHGKTGCLCYLCDDKTPDYVAATRPLKGLIKPNELNTNSNLTTNS